MHVLNQTQVPVLQLPPLVLTKLVSFYKSMVSVQYVLSLDKTITEIKKIHLCWQIKYFVHLILLLRLDLCRITVIFSPEATKTFIFKNLQKAPLIVVIFALLKSYVKTIAFQRGTQVIKWSHFQLTFLLKIQT